MPFQIKNFTSITAAEINHAKSVSDRATDFLPGSAIRTLLEAPAVEIEELYIQMFLGLRDAIPTAVFESFQFNRLQPAYAHGFVSVATTPAPVIAFVVPIDTVFSAADGRTYKSTAAVTWGIGQLSINIPVVAVTIGLDGNIISGQINSSPSFNSSYSISNSDILTGRDLETDSEREIRFAEYIASLSRGTVVACLYAAKLAEVLASDGTVYEYVTRRGLAETGGRVYIYLYSSRGIPSAQLLLNAQRIIDGYKDPDTGAITEGYAAAGVRFDVLAMTERLVPFSVKVGMQTGYALTDAVKQQIADIYASVIRSVEPETTLQQGTIVELMLAADGVQSIVPQTSENVVCSVNEALKAGVLTIAPL